MADYVRAAVEAAVKIHEEDLPGDILIFLTGPYCLSSVCNFQCWELCINPNASKS